MVQCLVQFPLVDALVWVVLLELFDSLFYVLICSLAVLGSENLKELSFVLHSITEELLLPGVVEVVVGLHSGAFQL